MEKHIITHNEIMSLTLERERYIRLAEVYVRNRSDAEDLYHDCILQIISGRDRLYVSDVKSYFATVIRNRCLHWLKKKQKSETMDSDTGSLGQYLFSRLQVNGEEGTSRTADFPLLFRKCQDRLPELTMEVFEAKRLEKMSYKQISMIFGISESRINFEIKRALKVFREEFKDYGLFSDTIAVFFGIFAWHSANSLLFMNILF